MGRRVKLIPPQYVKPFVKRSKNDRNGAEAINQAASRPGLRTVPVRTVDEQAATMIVKHRDRLVGQRMQAINALRGHAAEFGIVAAKGCGNVAALVSFVGTETVLPAAARSTTARTAQGQPAQPASRGDPGCRPDHSDHNGRLDKPYEFREWPPLRCLVGTYTKRKFDGRKAPAWSD